MLPKVNHELISTYLASLNKDGQTSMEMYVQMYEDQPVFKSLIKAAINETSWSYDKIDGYCKGMLQAWHLLNQQCIVEELNEW